jgi:hypothetical protein
MAHEPGNLRHLVPAQPMRSRIGWELWLGTGQWALITDVHLDSDDVLITVEDGTTYRAGYLDAIRCREPARPH